MKKETLMKYKSVIVLVIFSAIIAMLNERFLTLPNILNIFRQTSINGVIAAGMTFVILTGGIDLSVGSVLAISGALTASLIASGTNVYVAVLIGLLAGLASGLVSGIIITKGKVQPFIATLVMMTILRGFTMVFTNGMPLTLGQSKASDAFYHLGSGYILGIPVPVYIMVFVFVGAYYLLTQMKIGRYVYAVGGNEGASKLSGLNTDRIKIFVYSASGILAALAGIILTSRLSSAQPTAGTGYELDAIAAVVLGGTSLSGGQGTVFGTVVGVLIIGILNNALNLMDVSSYYQMIAKGLVILLAVLLDRSSKK